MTNGSSGEYQHFHPDFTERVEDVRWLGFALMAENTKKEAGERNDANLLAPQVAEALDRLTETTGLTLAMVELEVELLADRYLPKDT